MENTVTKAKEIAKIRIFHHRQGELVAGRLEGAARTLLRLVTGITLHILIAWSVDISDRGRDGSDSLLEERDIALVALLPSRLLCGLVCDFELRMQQRH